MNRSVGQIFRGAISPSQLDWVIKAPMVEYAINSSISESTGFAPFELTYGYMPSIIRQLPDGHVAPPGVTDFAKRAMQYIADAHDAIIARRVFQRNSANACRRSEPEIKVDDKVYLSTANLALPKGRAGKLLPRYIGPYTVLKALPETSNYELELPAELAKRRLHRRFHVNLLKPHQANDDVQFPGRASVDAYDWGAPDDVE